MDIQEIVGLGSGYIAVGLLTQHIKLFFAAMPWTKGKWTEGVPAAPWPLVADLLGGVLAILLDDSGLLDGIFALAGVDLKWPLVFVLGMIAFGTGMSAIVDGKRALRAPAGA